MGKRGKRKRKEKRKQKRMPKRTALVIGLNYPGTKQELRCGVTNARRVKAALVKHFHFHHSNVVLMTDLDDDSSARDVTVGEVSKQLSTMIKDGKKGDIMLLYFCGHGDWEKERKYMNNSGYAEMMSFSKDTWLLDTDLRDFTETVAKGCSFSAVIDCCHSGAMLEGAKEIIGDSTLHPTTSQRRAPKNKGYSFGKPSDRPLGVQVSCCQNYELAYQVYIADLNDWTTFFTHSFLSLIEEKGGNMTNQELVESVTEKMARMYDEKKTPKERRNAPGLYCDEGQKNLKFLSAEVEE